MITKDLFFLSEAFKSNKGGLNKAIISRANMLATASKQVNFLTIGFLPELKELVDDAYFNGSLEKNVIMINLFAYFEKKSILNSIKEPLDSSYFAQTEEEGYQSFSAFNHSVRFYKDGLYRKYKRFNAEGELLFIDYFNDARNLIKRENFNKEGVLIRKRHYSQVTGKVTTEEYINRNGDCYLSMWIDEKEQRGRCLLPFENKEFKTYKNLVSFWVTQLISMYRNPCVTTDHRHLDDCLLKIKHENITRIAVVHSSHLAKPYTDISRINGEHKKLLESIDQFDHIVFLTKDQLNDVITIYGTNERFNLIPHAIPEKAKCDFSILPKNNLAVTIGRLEDVKNLDSAIRAFSRVIKDIPTAEYHIYGSGTHEDHLNQLIVELRLKNNVFLKGYTTNSVNNLREATISILSSKNEGFGLVITESMSAGTPVISYNTKYGPAEIIRNNIDGFIVDYGNENELAAKIISIMNDLELRNRMSEKSLQVSERFSTKRFIENWTKLLESKPS